MSSVGDRQYANEGGETLEVRRHEKIGGNES